MQNNIINKSIRGGLIATTAMTIVMLMAPLMGMPNMLIGIMLAHFMIGSFIALGYVLSVEKLPGNRVLKGMLYSLLPFLIAQSVVMPVMGAGFFSARTAAPMIMIMGSLIGHLVYGAVLGFAVKSNPVEKPIPAWACI